MNIIPAVLTVVRSGRRTLLGLTLLCASAGIPLKASEAFPEYGDRRIKFPDVPGYLTLKCDFHIHTIFSDGKVWPDVRVEEALREGLDVIAITDHLEWNPHRVDVPFPDQNRSYDIALNAARNRNLIVIRSAEVTRLMPPEGEEPGHLNTIFVKDANLLKKPDATEVLREAAKQEGFVIWNHPSWLRQTTDGVARITPLHQRLLDENLIQGVEVVNQNEYSDEALQIALERNLAIIGSSDIHAPIDWFYPGEHSKHRPTTFVFAKEKTEASVKEALLARRTAVWYKNSLIGREDSLIPLLQASITAKSEGYQWATSVLSYQPRTTVLNVRLFNSTDADFVLRNASPYRMYNQTDVFILPAHGSIYVQMKLLKKLPEATLEFEVMNTVTAPGKHAFVKLTVSAKPDGPVSTK